MHTRRHIPKQSAPQFCLLYDHRPLPPRPLPPLASDRPGRLQRRARVTRRACRLPPLSRVSQFMLSTTAILSVSFAFLDFPSSLPSARRHCGGLPQPPCHTINRATGTAPALLPSFFCERTLPLPCLPPSPHYTTVRALLPWASSWCNTKRLKASWRRACRGQMMPACGTCQTSRQRARRGAELGTLLKQLGAPPSALFAAQLLMTSWLCIPAACTPSAPPAPCQLSPVAH